MQWAGEDELIYSDKEQHGKNSSALKKYGEKKVFIWRIFE